AILSSVIVFFSRFEFASEPYQKIDGGHPLRETFLHHPVGHDPLDWLCRPSITPSINQLNACGCHFWIKDGAVEWCRDSRRSSVSGCE
ncbi:DUF6527 family protein, partial [Sphingomonas koreensis]